MPPGLLRRSRPLVPGVFANFASLENGEFETLLKTRQICGANDRRNITVKSSMLIQLCSYGSDISMEQPYFLLTSLQVGFKTYHYEIWSDALKL